jgi:hypothetical protein
LRSILRIGKQFYAGLNLYEDFYIYTNRGLGTFWLRIRINCRPEISRFSLTPLALPKSEHRKSSVAEPIIQPRRRRRIRPPRSKKIRARG